MFMLKKMAWVVTISDLSHWASSCLRHWEKVFSWCWGRFYRKTSNPNVAHNTFTNISAA